MATTKDGRFAFSGFASIGGSTYGYDSAYNRTKHFIIPTGRCIVRRRKAEYKILIGNNKYDEDGKNPHAGEHIWLEVKTRRGRT